MNDEFLYRLRKDPPPRFAARLKARLDAQPRPSLFATRPPLMRIFMLALCLGGSALALTWWMSRPQPGPISGGADVIASPRSPPPQPHMQGSAATNSQTDPPVARVAETTTLDAASKPAGSGPLAIVSAANTSALTRVLIEAAAENLPKPRILQADETGVIRTFCDGIDDLVPGLAIATSRITPQELAACRRGGVRRIGESKLGYQTAIVTSSSGGLSFKLTPRDIYLALAKQIQDPTDPSALIDNPYRSWDEVNPKLEPWPIHVYGPPRDSPAREVFTALLLEPGCKAVAWIDARKKVDPDRYRSLCDTLREDGAYIEVPEASIMQALWAAPQAQGIVGFDFYRANRRTLVGSLLDGPEPTFETIPAGAYRASRPLYLYLNWTSLLKTPGAHPFVNRAFGEGSFGPSRYLTRAGVVDGLERTDWSIERRQFQDLNLQIEEQRR